MADQVTDSEEPEWLTPAFLPALTGAEHFDDLGASVVDFWRFALPDLRMNNARGYLAEFLVHRALGVDAVRVEWGDADVLWGEISIEVKSSAYLQSWAQRAPSRVKFTGLRARRWDPKAGYEADAGFKADVYVFAVQGALDHGSYDPLDVNEWRFYALPRAVLEELDQSSMTLAAVERRTSAVAFGELRAAIESAASQRDI